MVCAQDFGLIPASAETENILIYTWNNLILQTRLHQFEVVEDYIQFDINQVINWAFQS